MAKRIPLSSLLQNAAQMEMQRGAAAIGSGNAARAADSGARLAELAAQLAQFSGQSKKQKKSTLDKILNGVATVTGANYLGNALNDAIDEQQRSSWGKEGLLRETRYQQELNSGKRGSDIPFADWDPAVVGSNLKNLAGIFGRLYWTPIRNLSRPNTFTDSAADNLSKTMAAHQDASVVLDGVKTSLREQRQQANTALNRAQASPVYDAVGGTILAAGADPLMYALPEAGFNKTKVARALIESGQAEKAALVLRGGKSLVTSEELAKAGLEGAGGLKLFGRGPTLVPFDVTRQAGKATAPLRAAIGDIALDKGLYKIIGKGAEAGAEAPRVLMRSGKVDKAIPTFMLSRENATIKSMTAAEFGQLRNDFVDAFKQGRKSGWDYNEMVKWIETADPAAKEALAAGRETAALAKVQEGLSKVADMVEKVHGYRPGVEDFFPRLYAGPTKARSGKAALQEGYDILARRYKAGDKLSWGVQIPEGLDNAGVRQFIEESARETFGTKNFYSDNPLVALDAYLHGAEKNVRQARLLANAVEKYGTGESALAASLLQDPAAARAVRRNIIEELARFADQQAPAMEGIATNTEQAIAELARLQKLSTDASAGVMGTGKLAQVAQAGAEANATAALTEQIQKLRDLAGAAGTTRAEAMRATRAADALEARIADTVSTAATSTASQQAGVAAAAEHVKQQMTDFVEALKNSGYTPEAVASMEQRAQEIAAQMERVPAKEVGRKTILREASRYMEEAAQTAKLAQAQASEELQLVGILDTNAKRAWGNWTEEMAKQGEIVDLSKPLSKKQIAALKEGLTSEWRQTVQAMGQDQLPSHIAGFTVEFEKAVSNAEQFFRNYYDPIINWVKARQVATPGFVLRNFQGGAFNNWMAGVRTASYKQFLTLRTSEKALAKASVEDRMIYQQVRSMLGESQTLAGAEVNIPLFGSGNLRPWSPNFKPFRWLRTANEHTEADLLRGPMLWDTLKRDDKLIKAIRSGDEAKIAARMQYVSEEAVARVYKYHFDYSDLSNFEQRIMKRIVPFYTWTRNNIALQAEQLIAQPQKYYWKFRLENAVRSMSPQEEVVPEYWGNNKVRLPIKVGGSRLYYTPDMPFESAMDMMPVVGRPKEAILGSVAPLIKTPVEWSFKKQVYKDIPMTDEMKPAPAAWSKIPGLMPLLSTIQVPGTDLAFAKKGANGNYFMSARNQYVVEQALPEMARARRAVPSDKNSQAKALSAVASMLLGARVRANTPDEIRAELSRQKYAAKDQAAQDKRYRASGYMK